MTLLRVDMCFYIQLLHIGQCSGQSSGQLNGRCGGQLSERCGGEGVGQTVISVVVSEVSEVVYGGDLCTGQ